MLSPGYVSMPPVVSYPAPAFAPPQNHVPAQRQPLVRAKAPDEPTPSRPTPLTMPSPEQLGVVVRSAEAGPDWPAIHARIKELGIVSFHMDSLSDGRARSPAGCRAANPVSPSASRRWPRPRRKPSGSDSNARDNLALDPHYCRSRLRLRGEPGALATGGMSLEECPLVANAALLRSLTLPFSGR